MRIEDEHVKVAVRDTGYVVDKYKNFKRDKSLVSEKISEHIETENISPIVRLSDGQLRFVKVKDTQQLTFKYLETCLSEIIKNEEQVKKIVEYIKNKREVKYVSEIKRLYNN